MSLLVLVQSTCLMLQYFCITTLARIEMFWGCSLARWPLWLYGMTYIEPVLPLLHCTYLLPSW